MRWPRRRMRLWHPESPGVRVTVDVLWPRYLWVKGLGENGVPQDFATLGECIRRPAVIPVTESPENDR